jgi:regulator of sigma E protease
VLENLINIGIIILGFGVLIFFHELGHFLAAKWAGIRAEGFAIGMGPVIASYRRGIGVRFGSTTKPVDQRVHQHLESRGITIDPSAPEDQKRAVVYKAMEQEGIGETEYSLRWLPIGGFVKMLGQEDANPLATSKLKGSYQNAPIGKRMVVVSAGVIMNLIIGVVFFVWAFMVGVPFEAPIVGEAAPGFPAADEVPLNADDLGITQPGLQPGDRIVSIDGDDVHHFRDVAIASAMARPDRALELVVEREIEGQMKAVRFLLTPRMHNGLLTLGISPASSTRLYDEYPEGQLDHLLDSTTLSAQGVRPGMRLMRVALDEESRGVAVSTFQEFEQFVKLSHGDPIHTTWSEVDEDGEPIGQTPYVELPVKPELIGLQATDGFDDGLFGLSPLVAVTGFSEDSANADVLHEGDLFLRLAGVEAPRWSQFIPILQEHEGEEIEALVIREGEMISLTLDVDRKGRLGILRDVALDHPYTAAPIEEFVRLRPSPPGSGVGNEGAPNDAEGNIETYPSPVDGLEIYPGSRIISVNGIEVNNWRDIREALMQATIDSPSLSGRGQGGGSGELNSNDPPTPQSPSVEGGEFGGTGFPPVVIPIEIELPQPGNPRATVEIELSQDDIAALHGLGWRTDLESAYFESIQIVLSAEGNPMRAITMGFEETWTFVLHTYLTIDRLIRGTVGVEQLRGPVGIVHLGTTIAERGFMYIIFFLAMISVNLAVINFLPLPIVDGGLFLFLVYEKLKGRPPSIAFQNAATIAGLVLIVGLFLLVTYNDIARLVGG